MKRGISTNRNVASHAASLKQHGIDFVFRYYSRTTHQPEKRLTLPEAEAISAAGLELAVVYEDGPTSLDYFSNSRGHLDGVNAHHYAQALHQPPSSAVYFAIDYDATFQHISGAIYDYFRGVDQGMRDAGGGSSSYTIGVYGSGAACRWLKAHYSFVKYTWLAESTGWLGSSNYTDWDVKQIIATGSLGGLTLHDYEDCQAQDDFGGFMLDHAVPTVGATPTGAATPPTAGVKQQSLTLLEQEWSFFGRQTMDTQCVITHSGHKEDEPGFYQRVGKYWQEALGEHLDGRDDVPWSAAFVSWIMKIAGVGNRFHYAAAHSSYISKAINDRIHHNAASYFLGYRLNEYKVQPGDLVCRARQSGIDYDHQHGGAYFSHGDIVVAVRDNEIDVIGGNVSNSVTKRTLKLDAQGFLTDNSARYFAVIENKLS